MTVTSTARHLGRPVEKAAAGASSPYRPWSAYGMSKLANYHFGIGLQRRFASARARAASLMAHPGLSHTELQTTSVKESGGGRSQRFFQWLAATVGTTPARGALAQLRAGTDPTARGGELYTPRYVNWGPPVRRPVLPRPGLEHAIDELWELSQQQAGVSLDVHDQLAAIGR